ncbi:MAG: transposase, partial [Acidimicrobiia bacterium]|nr:transposase [Acidimicrobiia bacterium]
RCSRAALTDRPGHVLTLEIEVSGEGSAHRPAGSEPSLTQPGLIPLGETRAFMALLTIGQHFGRPYTPTNQAWIETLWGHVKAENPHLCTITDPEVLAAELERARSDYNAVRLHEGIGYVTPNDEHTGRGEAVRQARRDGLAAADTARRAAHRAGLS